MEREFVTWEIKDYGDWNDHVGINRNEIKHFVVFFSVGNMNLEGKRVVEFCLCNYLAVMKTFYKHQESHKWKCPDIVMKDKRTVTSL